MAFTQVSNDGIAPNTVAVEDCNWYSQGALHTTGALKLPRGNTAERPTTHTGGRENVTFDLKVTANVVSSDPGFLQNEPWLWSWAKNYNRAAAATDVTDTSSITLFKGSRYTFNNHTVGHGLFLRHTEKTDSNAAIDQYALTASDGIVSGTQGTLAPDTSTPSSIVLQIPTDYAYNQVVIQHGQTGMANVITVSDPPAETLGYIRLNTDVGNTFAIPEIYTGTGWKSIAYADSAGAQEQPAGTLSIVDNGLITASATTNVDDGVITDATTTVRQDGGGILLLAFLSDNLLGVDSGNALFVHDGSTPGGYEIMKADQSNLKGNLVNKRFTMYRFGAQTLTACNVNASNTARLPMTTTIEDGIGQLTLEDSNRRIQIDKDVTNSYLKFELKFKVNNTCDLQLWKNGSKVSYADYTAEANFHHTFSWMEPVSFGDELEFRLYHASNSSITITDNDMLIVELVGS